MEVTQETTIDFVDAEWGHNLHADTFHETVRVPDEERAVFTVMVHSRTFPRAGNLIKYRNATGTAVARVIGVSPCGDPPDMFKIECERTRELRLLDTQGERP